MQIQVLIDTVYGYGLTLSNMMMCGVIWYILYSIISFFPGSLLMFIVYRLAIILVTGDIHSIPMLALQFKPTCLTLMN